MQLSLQNKRWWTLCRLNPRQPPVAIGSADQILVDIATKAEHCRRCDLYRDATRIVFGEGPADARIVMVGEQPGDHEDLSGRPFVGPAGILLGKALSAAGVARESVYLTNAVKHFKHEERGKRQLHKRPNSYEIERCRWWLDQEIVAIDPVIVVALGALAASFLMDAPVTLARQRGRLLHWRDARLGIATIHPSFILRTKDEAERSVKFNWLVDDLRIAREQVERLATR